VRENENSRAVQWQQQYVYDRYGNRTIDQTNTTANVPHPLYTLDPANNNQLLAPAGYLHLYDAAGNQTRDTYAANDANGGQRTYDAENRMITATQSTESSNPTSYYTYDGDGHGVRRKVNNVETWQVYGFDGELLAEYAKQGAATAPQKEYGYRNGQLLITAEAPTTALTNVALAANGGVASSSSYLGAPYNYYPSYVNDGARSSGTSGAIWLDNTISSFPDWVEVDFNAARRSVRSMWWAFSNYSPQPLFCFNSSR
jgi:hypothetical protein